MSQQSSVSAKQIHIKLIDSKSANRLVKRIHYSGAVQMNSQIHFGVFLNDRLEGALQFGPSIDKRRMAQNLGIGFGHFLELNRMAFSDVLPKNSESRALGYCLRTLRKQYPFIRVIISFADACQCGDGTIYRASGFKLHSYKKNTTMLLTPDGNIVADINFNTSADKKHMGFLKAQCKPLVGYQMKYLYFFDKELEKKFKFIQKVPEECKMYKGTRPKHSIDASGFQSEEGGVIPTWVLHSPTELDPT